MPLPLAKDIQQRIRDQALGNGFDALGFARPEIKRQARQELVEFLRSKMHGDMGWLAKNAVRRADPQRLWNQAKTVIVLGVDYTPDYDPMELLHHRQRGVISAYAQGRDYHKVMKKSLKALGRWIVETFDTHVKIFVDTAPVMEKHLAQNAGLGWQGKHTNLVSRDIGSWFFLGEIFTSLDLAVDPPETDHCGSCRACLDICPTGALRSAYRMDANLCISYLTIEYQGIIPLHLREKIGNRIYGCDDCLAVCPWNKFATPSRHRELAPADLHHPYLRDLARLDHATFAQRFSGSPIRRLGRDRFIRNVLIAIGNSRDVALADEAVTLITDPASVVRASAIWSLSRLLPPSRFRGLHQRFALEEQNPHIQREWRDGLRSFLKEGPEDRTEDVTKNGYKDVTEDG